MADENEAFMQKLLETFVQEAQEHVDTLSETLLSLEHTDDAEQSAELIETLFREAHSLKGASRSVNISEIEELCKAMEEVLGDYKKIHAPMPKELIEVMLEIMDLLALLIGADATQRKQYKPQVQETIDRLVAVTVVRAGTPGTPVPQPVRAESAEPKISGGQERAPFDEERKTDKKEATTQTSRVRADTIRIAVDKLKTILIQSEELLYAKMVSKRHLVGLQALLEQIRESAKASSPKGRETFFAGMESMLLAEIKQTKEEGREVGLMVDRLLAAVKQGMTLPFSHLSHILPKTVHDLAKSVGKEVRLELSGGDVEIDRRVLEEMHDPLIHLLRNATDHGIEMPEIRRQKGKTPEGRITLEVAQKSTSKVQITVRDDGGGIDTEKVCRSAVKNGVIAPEQAKALEPEAVMELMFHSGVSTSDIVTDLSGRGLGLAIVREKAERLGGRVWAMNLEEGGSEFTVEVPLTMATFRGIVTSVGDARFIFPSEHVVRVTELTPEQIRNVEGEEMAVIDHRVVPFYTLGSILELTPSGARTADCSAVVVGLGGEMLAIGVERVHYEEEVMVKSLGKQLSRVRNIGGAALLASDRPGLILNISDLFKSVGTAYARSELPEQAAVTPKKRILVVDDSPTTRILLQNIMEMAGYDVVAAADGLEAYEALKNEPFGLVVTDVRMPRMNGFELTESIRADSRLSEIPVVLLTSLETPEDRERGLKAGADAYIVKSTFDQNNLMEKIAWLID